METPFSICLSISSTRLSGRAVVLFLAANYTDGILILHKDRIIYEKYFCCLDETGKHAAIPMTKPIT